MAKDSSYTSKHPNSDGLFDYSESENAVWSQLFRRQMQDLKGKAAPEFLDNVTLLGLTQGNVPQIKEIDAALHRLSGAGVEGVPAIIPPSKFFKLLSERKFPVATFLRRPEDINYIEEPDIFHEVFGHCPMLTNSDFADFIQGFGQKAVELGKGYSWHLFRLFWFTVEFGMVKTPEGLRAYGAGIVSSPSEAAHACGPDAEVLDFDLLDILRTSYRIDIVQPVYFAVTGFAQLAACLDQDFAALINEARRLGDHPKRYTPAA